MNPCVEGTCLLMALALCGCASRTRHAPIPFTGAARSQIYDRAGKEFANGLFLKPLEDGAADTNALEFAPLFMQEMNGASTNVHVPSNTVIYFVKGKAQFHNRRWDQITYMWYCPEMAQTVSGRRHHGVGSITNNIRSPETDADAQAGGPAPLLIQGVRITMDDQQAPIIWEVLADTSGAEILFVSESLEADAVAEFGQPLPGRRYAIETDPTNAPNTIVARAIADGPMPMGPVLYCEVGGDIATVLCRCMPAQVKELIDEAYYRLEEVPGAFTAETSASGRSNSISGAIRSEQQRGRVASDWFNPTRLEQRLRFPREF